MSYITDREIICEKQVEHSNDRKNVRGGGAHQIVGAVLLEQSPCAPTSACYQNDGKGPASCVGR